MEVKAGYKMTEVGVIPEEWEALPLEEYMSFISYGFTNPMPTSESGIYMITAKDINHGRIQFDTARCTTADAYRTLLTAKSQPKHGDLLLTKDGTLGRLAVVDERTVCINQSVAILRPNSRAVPRFFKLLLEAPMYQKRMIEDAGGSTIKHIYITIVNRMPIALPPTKAEQETIAEALSDADALIESLEQLLAKNRNIKQGVMQEMLAGKKRLPGFSEEWVLRSISELAGGDENIVDGPFGSNLKNSDYTLNGVPVLQGLNITGDSFVWKEIRYISNEKAKDLMRSNARLGDLLTVKIGSVGFSAIVDNLDGHPFAIIPANLLRVRFRNEMSHPLFVLYALISDIGKKELRDLAANTAQPALSLSGFRRLELRVPKTIEEQAAIADIISDMDGSIAALETKLAKARLVKQGMMQELLTGRIRLV